MTGERERFEAWVNSLPKRGEVDPAKPLSYVEILSGLDMNVARHIWKAAEAAMNAACVEALAVSAVGCNDGHDDIAVEREALIKKLRSLLPPAETEGV